MKKTFTSKIFTFVRSLVIITFLLFATGKGFAQSIVGWDFDPLAGGANNYGPSPFSATTSNSDITVTGLTRGSGISTTGGTGAGNAWGGTDMQATSQANAITGNDFVTFTIKPNSGFTASLSNVAAYNIRRSASGASTGQWQYDIGSGFVNIGTAITWGSTTSAAGNTQVSIDLSGITALQSIPSSTTVTFRIVLWGGTGATGTWYLNDPAGTPGNDFTINGTVSAAGTPAFSFGGTLSSFTTSVGTPSAQQTYTISGSNLTPNQTNGISVTAPADFEVSLTSNTFTGTNGNTVLLSSNGTGNIVGEPVPVYVRYFPAASGTTSANITHSGAGVSPAQTLAVNGISTAYFYSKASGDLTDPTTFNTAADGSGTDAANFSGNNQTFEIRNRTTATITSNWTVSGTSSKIIVGSGVNFTIPSTNTVTGTIDVQSTGKLTLQNTTLPTLGSLASGSTVEYAQSGATTITNTTTGTVTYANLILSGSGTKTFDHAVTTVTGNLIYDGATNGPLTVEAAGTSAFTTINLGGDLTYLGSVTNPTDVDAYTLITTGTGTQTITGNGNTARFFKLTCNSSGNNVILSTSGGSTNLLLANISNSGGLQLNTGTNLTLNGNTVTWFAGGGGLISGAGTITGSPTSTLVINRALAGAFGPINFASGSRELGNLTINHSGTTPTITLGTALDIYGTLTITAGQIVLGANNLALKSTASATARFAATAVATPISYNAAGRVIVERYINSDVVGRKWHLLSGISTNSTQNIFQSWQESAGAGSNLGTWITSGSATLPGYDATSANSASILSHDSLSGNWVTPAATDAGFINDHPGYMVFVRGDRNALPSNALTAPTVLRTIGTLRQGPQAAITILNSNPAYTMLGNPYASPIDFEAIAGTTNLSQSFYVWDASYAGTYGVGGFRLVQRTGASTYTATPTTGSDNTLGFIHSGQAFFVKTDGVGDASVVFDESSKASSLSVVNPIVAGSSDQQIYTSLVVIGNGNTETLADAVRVRFSDAYTAATTDDALKMGNFGQNISSYRDDKKWIVELRPMIVKTDTIFLSMSGMTANNYRFKVSSIDFVQPDVKAWLQDAYTGKSTPLDLTGNMLDIDFTVTGDAASANSNRFRIVFENKTLQQPQTSTIVKAAQQGAVIAVDWKAGNQYNMKQYEVEKSTDGVNYTKVNTSAATGINGSNADYNWLDVNPAVGDNYYRIRSIGIGGDVKISQPVVVTIAKGNRDITVYPNPVTDRKVSLKFTGMDKGIYQLRLVNTSGQVVLTKVINHNGGSAIQTLLLGNRIAKGNYLLEILKPDNTKTNEAILITK